MMTILRIFACHAAIFVPLEARLGSPTTPTLPEKPLGYWGATFTGPMVPGANIWVCFSGEAGLNFKTKQDCNPAVPTDFSGLVFTNIGGGEDNAITLDNMKALPDMASDLRSGGFDGISFDFESISGFTTYDELKDSFVDAITAFSKANMLTLLTTSRSGWSSSLSAGFPEGKAGFTKFQQDVGPLFDIFSPQCYGTGKETGPVEEICGVTTGFQADYSNWHGVKLIIPSVGSAWLAKEGASDPLTTLRAADFWPADVQMTGYAVWVVRPTCPEGMQPFSDTPTPGVCTCGKTWADANTNPSNPKC